MPNLRKKSSISDRLGMRAEDLPDDSYDGHSGVITLLPIPWFMSSIGEPWNSSSIRATWLIQHFSFSDTEKPQVVPSPRATIRFTGSERRSIWGLSIGCSRHQAR